MTPCDLDIAIDSAPDNDIAVLRLDGSLDGHTFQLLDKIIQERFGHACYRIILDLSNLDYVSSAGCGQFVAAMSEALAHNGMIVLVNPSEFVDDILKMVELAVGQMEYVRNKGIPLSAQVEGLISNQIQQGRTAIVVARDTQAVGLIAIADEVRPETQAAISALYQVMGNKNITMLTGDNTLVASAVARQIGLEHFQAGLLPEQKQAFVKKLQDAGHTVGMIGDGINDAPALALADVGIAMGAAGTDVAIETADVTLMNDDLWRVVDFILMSRAVLRRIKLNIFLSIIYNVIGLALGVLGMLTPIMAIIFQEAGCISVVLSSALLLWAQPKRPSISQPHYETVGTSSARTHLPTMKPSPL